jgi:hypothetical protein
MAITPRLSLSLLDVASSGKETVVNSDLNLSDAADRARFG